MDKEKQFMEYSSCCNDHIFRLVPKYKKVLEVGCNTGNLGSKLIQEKGCKVWGIDYSKEAIQIAKKKLTKAIVFDLESYKAPFRKEKFDIIIFADVLEHIKYPERILQIFSKNLSKKGAVLASIPNIANLNTRAKLLFGQWNYKNNGLLDRTHLRFFTLKTIKRTFRESSYEIIKTDSTPGFKFLVLRHFWILNQIKAALCKSYPRLFALQFIILAVKK